MYHNLYYKDNLIQKMNDIFAMEPNDLGSRRLTALYKIVTVRFKSMPFLYILPLASGTAIFMYLLFGHLTVKLVSLLQYGF